MFSLSTVISYMFTCVLLSLSPKSGLFLQPHGRFLISWSLWTLETKHTNAKTQSFALQNRKSEKSLSPWTWYSSTAHSFHFHPFACKFYNSLLIYSCMKFRFVHVPHFHRPFFSWWTSGLVPFPCSCREPGCESISGVDVESFGQTKSGVSRSY